jgi:very-short-patch-repair endonuclease
MNNAERAVLALARRQHGAISRRQALSLGMSRGAIGHRLATGEWLPAFQGSYVLAGTARTFEQKMAAGRLAVGEDAVASYRGAAALLGMPGVPRWVELTVPRASRIEVRGIISHRTRCLPPQDVAEIQGIPATTAGRTIADLAPVYPKAKVGRLLDYAQAERLVTRAEMEARATGRKHDDVLRELLDERPATPRPMGSEFEAALFRILLDAGLPLPVAQYGVLMPDGTYVYVDFAYPDLLLILEADSYIWHVSLDAWRRDRERNSELVVMGWSILPITWDLVRFGAAEVARRVGRARKTRLAS